MTTVDSLEPPIFEDEIAKNNHIIQWFNKAVYTSQVKHFSTIEDCKDSFPDLFLWGDENVIKFTQFYFCRSKAIPVMALKMAMRLMQAAESDYSAKNAAYSPNEKLFNSIVYYNNVSTASFFYYVFSQGADLRRQLLDFLLISMKSGNFPIFYNGNSEKDVYLFNKRALIKNTWRVIVDGKSGVDYSAQPLGDINGILLKDLVKITEKMGVSVDTFAKIVEIASWNRFIPWILAIRTLIKDKTYNMTFENLGKIIILALKQGDSSVLWLIDYIMFLYKETPIIASTFDEHWFIEASKMPIEFHVEQSKISSICTKNDYFSVCESIVDKMLKNYTQKEYYQRVKNMLMRSLVIMPPVDGVDSSANIVKTLNQRFYKDRVRIEAKANNSIVPMLKGIVPYSIDCSVEALMDAIFGGLDDKDWDFYQYVSGLSVYGVSYYDIVGNSLVDLYGIPTTYRASMLFLRMVNGSVDALYRWLVWLYIERLLFDHKITVDLYAEFYGNKDSATNNVVKNVPEELKNWVVDGKPIQYTSRIDHAYSNTRSIFNIMHRYPATLREYLEKRKR